MKEKHLEFIQQVISRMNSNSFLIKGWTVALTSAVLALTAKEANKNYALISFVIIPIFWMLDGFYLSQERQYRSLYEDIRKRDASSVDYNMNASSYNKGRNTWVAGIFSETLTPLYVMILFITVVIINLIK